MDIPEMLIDLNLLTGIISFLFAALFSFVVTPLIRVLAFKIGAVDVPCDERRMHKVPIPRLGGLGVFLSFVLAVFLFLNPDNIIIATVIGSVLLISVGIIDDISGVRAIFKFLIQIAAALIAVSQGIVIERINIFGEYIHFGIFSIPITVLWITGLINAINLIDGLDGLSCGLSTISAVSLFFVTLVLGKSEIVFIITILVGACIGFLPFNKNPAKIFIGDTGAMFLGFVLAVVSIQGVFKVHAVLTFMIPFLILGLPIFDTAFAMIRRILSGRHPFSPDREHLHHRLIDMGFNQKQTVRILYAISAMLGISAIMLTLEMFVPALIVIAVSLGVSALTWIVIRNKQMRMESGLIDDISEIKDEMLDENAQAPIIEVPEEKTVTNDIIL